MRYKISVIIFAVVATMFLTPKLWAQENKQSTSPNTQLPPLEVIKACMDSREGAECLDKLFRDALKNHSTLEVLQLRATL